MKPFIPMTLAALIFQFCTIPSSAAQTTQTPTPVLPSGPSVGTLIGPFLIVLVFGVLAFLFRRWAGRKSFFQGKGPIDVLAARQVAPHRSVQVISVGGKNFLIGVGENIQLLSELPDDLVSLQTPPKSPTPPTSPTKLDFQQILMDYSARLWRKR